jgi:hypothetical protein
VYGVVHCYLDVGRSQLPILIGRRFIGHALHSIAGGPRWGTYARAGRTNTGPVQLLEQSSRSTGNYTWVVLSEVVLQMFGWAPML